MSSDWQDDTSWQIAEVGLPLLAIVGCGFVASRFRLFGEDQYQPIKSFNLLVFTFCIPATVFQGLATNDLVEVDWNFVALFLIWRIIVGVGCGIAAIVQGHFSSETSVWKNDKMGLFLTNFIGTSWINTIIFGIPIVKSVYGPKSVILNILAALSSLFAQLPFMLLCFEWRSLFRRQTGDTLSHYERRRSSSAASESRRRAISSEDRNHVERPWEARGRGERLGMDNDSSDGSDSSDSSRSWSPDYVKPSPAGQLPKNYIPADLSASAETGFEAAIDHPVPLHVPGYGKGRGHTRFNRDRGFEPSSAMEVVKSLLYGLLTNPPQIGIIVGIIYSVAVNHNVPDGDEVLPEIIRQFCTFLGNCTTPLAAFTIGMFMDVAKLRGTGFGWNIGIYLLFKHALLPILTIGLCDALDIKGENARVAVLISCLPVALASFSLATRYDCGQSIQSSCVVFGTMLMIPVFLMWQNIMEEMDIFVS